MPAPLRMLRMPGCLPRCFHLRLLRRFHPQLSRRFRPQCSRRLHSPQLHASAAAAAGPDSRQQQNCPCHQAQNLSFLLPDPGPVPPRHCTASFMVPESKNRVYSISWGSLMATVSAQTVSFRSNAETGIVKEEDSPSPDHKYFSSPIRI